MDFDKFFLSASFGLSRKHTITHNTHTTTHTHTHTHTQHTHKHTQAHTKKQKTKENRTNKQTSRQADRDTWPNLAKLNQNPMGLDTMHSPIAQSIRKVWKQPEKDTSLESITKTLDNYIRELSSACNNRSGNVQILWRHLLSIEYRQQKNVRIFVFTTKLNGQASERVRVCVAWRPASASCVCTLTGNGRQPRKVSFCCKTPIAASNNSILQRWLLRKMSPQWRPSVPRFTLWRNEP